MFLHSRLMGNYKPNDSNESKVNKANKGKRKITPRTIFITAINAGADEARKMINNDKYDFED